MKHACPSCAGRGYLLDETNGYADIPDGWTPVQACAFCGQIGGDQDAAILAASDLDILPEPYKGGGCWVPVDLVAYFPGPTLAPDGQTWRGSGDWAIHWTGHANADEAAGPLLTDLEHETIRAIGQVWNKLCQIVGDGPTRSHDLAEMVTHVHAVQHFVMGQAAARAYPDMYRLAGGTLRPDDEDAESDDE